MITIVGCPYDQNSSFMRGAAEAPSAIRAALFADSANLWTEDGIDLGIEGRMEDGGDLPAAPVGGIQRGIGERIDALLDAGRKVIALGGDHSISYPVVKAVARKHRDLTIVHFDAHPDLYNELRGNRFSHGRPFTMIMEERLAKRLVQMGIRTATDHQRDQARRFRVEMIEMKDWRDTLPDVESPVYVSFDLDALDPAFAPGVVHREPGGLSVRQVVKAIQGLRADLVGADIVEFNPRLDPQHITGAVCAKLLKEIAARMLG